MGNCGYEKYEDVSSQRRNRETQHDDQTGTDRSVKESDACAIVIVRRGQVTPCGYLLITE